MEEYNPLYRFLSDNKLPAASMKVGQMSSVETGSMNFFSPLHLSGHFNKRGSKSLRGDG